MQNTIIFDYLFLVINNANDIVLEREAIVEHIEIMRLLIWNKKGERQYITCKHSNRKLCKNPTLNIVCQMRQSHWNSNVRPIMIACPV